MGKNRKERGLDIFWSNSHTTHAEQKPTKLKLSTVTGIGLPTDKGMGRITHAAHEVSMVSASEGSFLDPQ